MNSSGPETDERLARLYALQEAASAIADGSSALGQAARVRLADTGLSPEGIDYALNHCLEFRAGRARLSELRRRAPRAPRAHVLLSANVFVAAYRAIAVALAQTDQVFVRASRRSPSMVQLLHEASGHAFELVETLSPTPGDHFWAYGSDETLAELRQTLPAGVWLHAHGAGMGAVVICESALRPPHSLPELARALARDTFAFDQKGCLSPRLVLIDGRPRFVDELAQALAEALSYAEVQIPRGPLTPDEEGDRLRYEQTMTYVAETYPAGRGLVVVDPEPERLFVPPVGRYLGLVRTHAPLERLAELQSRLTNVAVFGPEDLPGRIQALLGERRIVDVGSMQTPPLDGPVDLRSGWDAELL